MSMEHTPRLWRAPGWTAPHARGAGAGVPGAGVPHTGAQSRARQLRCGTAAAEGNPLETLCHRTSFHTKLGTEAPPVGAAGAAGSPSPQPLGEPPPHAGMRFLRAVLWETERKGKQESSTRAERWEDTREEHCRSPATPGCAEPSPPAAAAGAGGGGAAAPSPGGPSRSQLSPNSAGRAAPLPRPGDGGHPAPPRPPPSATHRQAEQQQRERREPPAAPRSPRALPRHCHPTAAPDPLRTRRRCGCCHVWRRRRARRHRPPAPRHDGGCSPARAGDAHPSEGPCSSRSQPALGNKRPTLAEMLLAITQQSPFRLLQQRLKSSSSSLTFHWPPVRGSLCLHLSPGVSFTPKRLLAHSLFRDACFSGVLKALPDLRSGIRSK